MTGRLRIGCCAEIAEQGWRWVAEALGTEAVDWTFFYTSPQTRVERLIRKPRLARYRACRQLASGAAAGEFDLIVTHHPLVTCWTETFRRGRGRSCPHIAFSFNFTRLPTGPRLILMRRAFATVDRFIVFSTFERTLYSRYFGIPLSKIEMIHWGVREPEYWSASSSAGKTDVAFPDALCAVGSQARDYATLLEAMQRLPGVRLMIVATTENMRGLSVPNNVTVRLNIPRTEAELVIRHSRFMVLPLSDTQVPCGHVTMVTAMFLSRAIIATESAGITDYVTSGRNGLTVPPRDPAAMAAAIESLWNDPETAHRLGENGRAFALANCTEAGTVAYVRTVIERFRAEGHV